MKLTEQDHDTWVNGIEVMDWSTLPDSVLISLQVPDMVLAELHSAARSWKYPSFNLWPDWVKVWCDPAYALVSTLLPIYLPSFFILPLFWLREICYQLYLWNIVHLVFVIKAEHPAVPLYYTGSHLFSDHVHRFSSSGFKARSRCVSRF